MEQSIDTFIQELSSKEPTPGGGGASALVGAVGVALCSMVANLTCGKEKYAAYQKDIETILERTQASIGRLLSLIQKDAESFAPLAAAYHIPKDNLNRENVLEKALITACSVPYEIIGEIAGITDILEQLYEKGTKLAKSDVAVAAAVCNCAVKGAIMNIYINTNLLKNKVRAKEINDSAERKAKDCAARCDIIYQKIDKDLRG